MAVFICYRQGCPNEVVHGTHLCRPHLLEEAAKRKEAGIMTEEPIKNCEDLIGYDLQGDGTTVYECARGKFKDYMEPDCDGCTGDWGGRDVEYPSCRVCHRKVGSPGVKRLYGDKCNRCKAASKAAPPPRDSEPAAGGGETKPPVAEPQAPEPTTKEPVLTEEPCQDDKKSPGAPDYSSAEPTGRIIGGGLLRLGKEIAPADEVITVTVDFTRYPNIHKSLLELAEKEFRTPANQLLYLLHDHLEGLEETAKKQEGAADGR